jgi:uncharacterized membrane protein HdeD (DUF308 family)
MKQDITRLWWLVSLRGLVAVGFGIGTLLLSGHLAGAGHDVAIEEGLALAAVFAMYLTASSMIILAAGTPIPNKLLRRSAIAYATILMYLGAGSFFFAQRTLEFILWLTIVQALASVLGDLLLARLVRHHAIEWGWSYAASFLSLAWGVQLILEAYSSAREIAETIGVYALFYGGLVVLAGTRLREAGKHAHAVAGAAH